MRLLPWLGCTWLIVDAIPVKRNCLMRGRIVGIQQQAFGR